MEKNQKIRHFFGLENISPDVYRKITRHNALCGIGCTQAMIVYALVELFSSGSSMIGKVLSALLIVFLAAVLAVCLQTVRGRLDHPVFVQVLGQTCLLLAILFCLMTGMERLHQGDHFVIMMAVVTAGLCLFRLRPVISVSMVVLLHFILMYVTAHFGLWADISRYSCAAFLALTEIVSLVCWHTSLSGFVQEGNMADANSLLQQDNETWRQASVKDSLTGLYNRYAFRRDQNAWMGRVICVMMCDVDNFKHYNDSFGHDAGDRVLIRFGSVLQKSFGERSCYRYGGDEFLVVAQMPALLFLEEAQRVETKMCQQNADDEIGPVGVSMGFVYGRCRDQMSLVDFIRQADRKLYQAKAQGKRNVKCGEFIPVE